MVVQSDGIGCWMVVVFGWWWGVDSGGVWMVVGCG